jgi:hypothetical protein
MIVYVLSRSLQGMSQILGAYATPAAAVQAVHLLTPLDPAERERTEQLLAQSETGDRLTFAPAAVPADANAEDWPTYTLQSEALRD